MYCLLFAGPEAVTSPQVECCLQSLGVGQSLPPVHWAGILTPLMRLNFSKNPSLIANTHVYIYRYMLVLMDPMTNRKVFKQTAGQCTIER